MRRPTNRLTVTEIVSHRPLGPFEHTAHASVPDSFSMPENLNI